MLLVLGWLGWAGLAWAGLAGLGNVRRMYGDCMERAAGTGTAVLCSTVQYGAVQRSNMQYYTITMHNCLVS